MKLWLKKILCCTGKEACCLDFAAWMLFYYDCCFYHNLLFNLFVMCCTLNFFLGRARTIEQSLPLCPIHLRRAMRKGIGNMRKTRCGGLQVGAALVPGWPGHVPMVCTGQQVWAQPGQVPPHLCWYRGCFQAALLILWNAVLLRLLPAERHLLCFPLNALSAKRADCLSSRRSCSLLLFSCRLFHTHTFLRLVPQPGLLFPSSGKRIPFLLLVASVLK